MKAEYERNCRKRDAEGEEGKTSNKFNEDCWLSP
jgi:hypothetical protein